MRDAIIIKRYMYEALNTLNDADRLRCYDALLRYAFDDTEIPKKSPESFLYIIKDKLDATLHGYESYKARVGAEYQRWRKQVLAKCGKKCQMCGSTENIEVHHIVPIAENKDLRYAVDNGMVLCRKCHKEVHRNR